MKKIMLSLALCFALLLPHGAAQAADKTDCSLLENIFRTKVESEHGVCKVEVIRSGLQVTHNGVKLSPEMMDLAFAASFERVGEKTAVIGEFALLEREVNPVIDALRKGNLQVTAVHNHMIGEQPRILYVHFQGTGDLRHLADAVNAAIL